MRSDSAPEGCKFHCTSLRAADTEVKVSGLIFRSVATPLYGVLSLEWLTLGAVLLGSDRYGGGTGIAETLSRQSRLGEAESRVARAIRRQVRSRRAREGPGRFGRPGGARN